MMEREDRPRRPTTGDAPATDDAPSTMDESPVVGAAEEDLAGRRARRRRRVEGEVDGTAFGPEGPTAGAERRVDADPEALDERREPDRPPSPETTSELDERTTLLPGSESERFAARWKEIQVDFVDDPEHAVQQADGLVADVLDRIQDVFSGERSALERQLDREGEVSTEDLRQALRRYRAFFERLLSL